MLEVFDGHSCFYQVRAEEHLVRARGRRCARRATFGAGVDDVPARGAESGSDGGRADAHGGG
jgi:hypothetical protein